MTQNQRSKLTVALLLTAPFITAYGVLFLYPTVRMIVLSFTNAPLVGDGTWAGFGNFVKLLRARQFWVSLGNTSYFVALTVVPSTLLGLVLALGVNRLKGYLQSIVLSCFFIPYIMPVAVIFRIWSWMFDKDYGVAQYIIEPIFGQRIAVFRTLWLFMPSVAFVTVWWLVGFNVLLFIAGLRNISPEIYEAASLDGAGRWQQFARITWPLVWPITVLVLTIQLILQLRVFDLVYLFANNGRTDPTMVLVQYIYKVAFQQNLGGLGAAISLMLFLIVVLFSLFQYQILKRGTR